MIRDTTALPNEEDIRLEEGIDQRDILRIIESHNGKLGGLTTILSDIQAKYGYLPKQSLKMLADETGCSLVDIYGVATFYHSFSLKPQGKHLVCVCLGTACHVRGVAMIVEEFERRLGVKVGQTTVDGEFTLETVNCLGACAIGPIVAVDNHYFPKVDTTKVRCILERVRAGLLQDEESLTGAGRQT